ncbi:MalY/PatB family protein [Nitratidesulfovibrio sp. D1]|uniref:MalY/PatB family protein n=1 Tax=Nitratidesulfovibrio sp. D1 TaxID=3440151 RepID=UPI003EBE8A4B
MPDHTFDFDHVPDRRNTGSLKWDDMGRMFNLSPAEAATAIPLWVADMDFPSPPAVREAVARLAAHGVFGYPAEGAACREAVAHWLSARHGWTVNPRRLLPVPTVVAALCLAVRLFARPGDGVVVQTPVYPPFYEAVRNAGCRVLANPLALTTDASGNPLYEMDFDALDAALADGGRGARVLLLCSPHNPGGRVWTRAELTRVAELCLKHGTLMVSDEIHHDLLLPGHAHTVLASLSPEVAGRTITAVSAAKTFNVPGAGLAHVIIEDATLRRTFRAELTGLGIRHPNMFGLATTEAACRHGGPWLDALMAYIAGNAALVREVLGQRLPSVRVMQPQSTYLSWVDFRPLGLPEADLLHRVRHKAGVVPSPGSSFGPDGEGWLRLNLGCPRPLLRTALDRMADVLGK